MSFDDDFYKKIMEMMKQLMTPEGQRKIREFINKNPDFLKNNPFFMNINPADLQKFIEYVNKNPNIKVNIGAMPGMKFPFDRTKDDEGSSGEEEPEIKTVGEPSCFWIDDEYHIILNYPTDCLKFKTAVHKKDKNKILLIAVNDKGEVVKKVKLPPTISYKKHTSKWNNGIYEIIYNKKNK
ncbi:MAG: hypothetical protein GF329_00710 [Candidatus Lokiarchaeota archaeon]|nr:hypothetical protein [Candidatus Lokiarchaeota archaeon]